MRINEDVEMTIKLAPHTMEALEEASKEKGMDLQMMIRLVLNEWALRNEQLKNKKDR